VTPPVGTVVINGGDLYTNKTGVTLTTLSANDADGVKAYCVSNTSTCPSTSWKNYPPASNAWTLTTGNGLKTVSAWFKDNVGNISPPISKSISLDATAPVAGKLTVTQPNLTSLKLDWSGFSDALSGMKGYELYHSTTAVPASCSVAVGTEKLFDDAGTTYTHTGLAANSTHYYRLCGVDNVLNKSNVTVSRKVLPELNPPADGIITINNGAEYATSTTVKLAFSANDNDSLESKVSGYCISNGVSCSSWKVLTTPVKNLSVSNYSWTLPTVNSAHTVSVWFRDIYGNTTSVPASATITLDTIKPAGKMVATQQPGSIKLDWTSFIDTVSHIKEYSLYESLTAAVPASCNGELLYTGTGTSYTHTSLKAGTFHYYRICATDNAGNTGSATVITKAIPELGAPNGSVSINEGVSYAKATVTLTIKGTDTSGVAKYCVSNTSTCPSTSWSIWSPDKDGNVKRSWTLLAGKSGDTRTVNVWFKDIYDIVTPDSVSDTVILDVTSPVNGTLTVTPLSLKNALTWSDFSDALSGIAGYRLMRGTIAPTTCAVGTPIATLTADKSSYEDTVGLKAGILYYYRLCAVDNAGNISTGVVKSGRPLP
jgi:hypothetical protein